MRAFLIDDEALALKRLSRLLSATGRVEIAGACTDPFEAVQEIAKTKPDLLFLDIEMPGMNGFEMLERLAADLQPLVVFTTAYEQYALRAFGVNSVDYLLKPIEASHLDRALHKIGRMRSGSEPRLEIRQLLAQVAAAATQGTAPFAGRIASRLGEKVEFVELSRVSHFYAGQKLTFASTALKDYVVDYTIQDLEQKLDPQRFLRIHRSTLVNLSFVHELHPWFAGGMLIRLKDEKRTELKVARDRVRVLKEKLGI